MKGFTNHWNQYLECIPFKSQDLYYREEYVRLYETETEKACSLIYQDGDSTLIFPFLKRTFEYKSSTYCDFETAYGYGGPITNNNDREFMAVALQNMKQKAVEENYICGFVRFHPLLKNWNSFENIGRLILDRKTIAIDISKGIDYAWAGEIHTKNRNVIKKGDKNKLEFVADYDFEHLYEFETLYNTTMDRLGADSFYYFGSDYYSQLKETIQNRFLGIVKYQDKVIAGAIFFYQQPYGHFHLAGSDREYQALSPNNFLLWEAAKELANHGVLFFHLGGGTDGSEENSLFQFKKKFSKSEYQFMLGKLIFNKPLYEEICTEWAMVNSDRADSLKDILLKYKF